MEETKTCQLSPERAIEILWGEVAKNQQPLHCTRKELCDAVEMAEESIHRAAPENIPISLPDVSKQDRHNMHDFLHDCFAEWVDDPSVGLHGMDEGEAALATAIMDSLIEPEKTENKVLTLEQLQCENAQLHAVIKQYDSDFFKRKCRVCGCNWNHPCNDNDFWAEDNLCSACAAQGLGSKHE